MSSHFLFISKTLWTVVLFITVKVTAQPIVTSFTPSSGPVGKVVTITGTNFNATPANNIVFFGAVKATVTAATTTTLTATIPAGATYQPLSVLDNATRLTGYSSKPFITTFPGSLGIPANFYKPKVDFATNTSPRNVATGDVDGDGKPDLLISNGNSDNISVLRNTSSSGSITTSSFAGKVDFASGTTFIAYVAIGDVNGDGKPDMVIVSNGNISVLRNTSVSGTLNASSFATQVDFTSAFTGPVFIAIGDMDGDGRPDLVTANSGPNSASVRLNTSVAGSISFATKTDFGAGLTPSSVAIGDVDGDGKPDLVITNSAAGVNTVSVLRNTTASGVLSFATKVDFATGATPRSVAIGDVDLDGKPDLVVANNATSPASTTISVLHNTSSSGNISFDSKIDFTAGTAPRYVSIGDVDGDSKPDVVVANMNSNNISVLRNTAAPGSINATSLAPKVDFATVANPVSVAIVDVDGDGIPEVAASNGSASFVSVFQINVSVLPVALTNVKTYQKNAGVEVEWTTQQEGDIDKYEVEKSQNGRQFFTLESIRAKNNNAVINYNLFDPNPFSGISFYRIKIIGRSGHVTYSQVMKINNSGGATLITVYPNPVMGNAIVVQMNNLRSGTYTITLTNKLGQQMINKVIEHPGGSASEIIESKVLSAGVYQLKLRGEGINIVRQVMKN